MSKPRKSHGFRNVMIALSVLAVWVLYNVIAELLTSAPVAQSLGVERVIALSTDSAPAQVVLPTVTPRSANTAAAPAPFTLATWNAGLTDASLTGIAEQIAAFDGVDIWLLQEVAPSMAAQLQAAAEDGENTAFGSVMGETGSGQQLLTLYSAGHFTMLDSVELNDINTTGNVRSPLVLHLRDNKSGVEFLVMNNHLYRSKEDQRDLQATLLNQWVRTQTLPVVEGGDHNFDYRVGGGPLPVDRGYDNMTAGGVWEWLQPAHLVTTECSDALPCRYDDVLDFVFVAGAAQSWPAVSAIVVRDGDFPDDSLKSDHRPVIAMFGADAVTIPASLTAAATTTAVRAVATTSPTAASGANLRAGPGTNYDIVGGVQAGAPLNIAGRSSDGQWLQLANGAWIFANLVTSAPSNLGAVDAPAAPVAIPAAIAPTATPLPAPPTATPVPVRAAPVQTNCDSHYPTICVPPPPPDLDCGDIPYRHFQVLPGDPHRFDGNHDGEGCES